MATPQFFAFLASVYLLAQLGYMVYYAFDFYQLNPFKKIIPLSEEEERFLHDKIIIYGRLPNHFKQKCDQRIVWFRSKKHFVFYGNTAKESELRLLLSAALAILTLGLGNYRLMRSLIRIVAYPSQYYSQIKRKHHLGEYNPRLKTVIFSADTIWKGFAVPDDNINLAIHEFAHALSFEMMRAGSWEARRFRVGLRQIKKLFDKEEFRQKIVKTRYFREYGMSNLHEFFSVAVENFFETPTTFQHQFPELFTIIRQMLNFDYGIARILDPPKK